MIEKSFSIFLSLFFALGGPACYSEPAVAHISAPDRNTLVQIAFGSCISDPSSPIWDSILATDPDVFILLGDTVYLEHEDLGRSKRIRARFHRLFSEPGFARLRKAIPTYAIWDDHDFGPNDGDSQFIHADVSRMVFRDFWSLPPTILDDKGGIYGKLHLPNVTVLLTDNRSYRRNPVSGKASQLFGPRQLAWIESELVQPRTPLVVIASGNQFLSDDTEPSEEGLWQYPAERKRLMTAIEDSSAQVVIISGDRHFAEILSSGAGDLSGREILEVTSSPLTASLRPLETIVSQRHRKALYAGGQNFGLLTIVPERGSLSIAAEIRDKFGKRVISSELRHLK